MNKIALFLAFVSLSPLRGAEWHVSLEGKDSNAGNVAAPFRSIQRAADVAQPGDCITVHTGTYRERINPPRGGTSEDKRITYRAAPGERVEIKGSEIVKGWVKEGGDVWKVTLPDSFFGAFNPFSDLIHGDWFSPLGRQHHTGAVYLDGEWLAEAARQDDVTKSAGSAPLWFAKVEGGSTTIWAQFKGVDPNARTVEVNVRRTVFYPDQPGRNYITVRGFILRDAATPWAPPTAEQIGLIGTHWSKGWIIEKNDVSHSICSGISLGKHGDRFDNTSANSAQGYVKTIERAQSHSNPWTKENIGHHIVRDNTVSHCEQAGIVGSLGCSFSIITGNVVHDIHVRRLFSGAEMAGIKFHGAIDTEISHNHVYRCSRGLWLDWMAQGARVSGNLFHDNDPSEDLFMEVNHGPLLVDNNIFLSRSNIKDWSEGGAFVHNLFAGKIIVSQELRRQTPFHPPHSTALAGLANIHGADDRFYNNIFIGNGSDQKKNASSKSFPISGYGLWMYYRCEMPLQAVGNVYLNGARPYAGETNALVLGGSGSTISLDEEKGSLLLRFDPGIDGKGAMPVFVTTALLGKAKISGVGYENPDGTPLEISTDYFNLSRSKTAPQPGPFERIALEKKHIQVWPISEVIK